METGIYLHIPFCRKACHYCDFHFSTDLRYREEMVNAMVREMEIRFSEAGTKTASIYFGGGTPSLLEPSRLDQLFAAIHRLSSVRPEAEITLEANPEDVNRENLKHWLSSGVNRLSIGLQSSHNQRLEWMNRSHSVEAGERAVKSAQDAGFSNITVDLMYGFPDSSPEELEEDIDYILGLQTSHISAYNLSIEPETVFGNRLKKGLLLPLPEEESAAGFLRVFDALEAAGFSGYEISNFALPGQEAVHNRNYWLQKAFTGIGPSAHGFDGNMLRWENSVSNARYMRDLLGGKLSEEQEHMSRSSLANEFILTRLRMKEGLPLGVFSEKFGLSLLQNREAEIQLAVQKGWLLVSEGRLALSREGRLFADHLALELFTEDSDFS